MLTRAEEAPPPCRRRRPPDQRGLTRAWGVDFSSRCEPVALPTRPKKRILSCDYSLKMSAATVLSLFLPREPLESPFESWGRGFRTLFSSLYLPMYLPPPRPSEKCPSAQRSVKAGETVLIDDPILIYGACPGCLPPTSNTSISMQERKCSAIEHPCFSQLTRPKSSGAACS